MDNMLAGFACRLFEDMYGQYVGGLTPDLFLLIMSFPETAVVTGPYITKLA